MVKRLLVTGDDFGMCHAINAGTLRALTQGILRSTNFLVPCPWFNEALALALRHTLPVGVHLCLTCEWDNVSWGPLTRGASLSDACGNFPASFDQLLERARDEEILAEYRAQIARVRQLGFEPTHVDSHMLPAADQSAAALRLKALIARVASETGLRYTYETDAAGKLRYFDAALGISGASSASVWAWLEARGPGTYQLIGHAAEPSAELEALCSPDHPSRMWAAPVRVSDLAFFTSNSTRQRLHDLGFELISVADL